MFVVFSTTKHLSQHLHKNLKKETCFSKLSVLFASIWQQTACELQF